MLTSYLDMSDCCKIAFPWTGKATGRESRIAGLDTYIASIGTTDKCILMIHDIFGWKFNNSRLLADIYAKQLNATVYLPDFFGGEVIINDLLDPEKNKHFDVMAFFGRNAKEIRFPEMQKVVKELSTDYSKLGAVGFCYGGWAVLQLAAKENQPGVSFISTAHPSSTTPAEITSTTLPVQFLIPEYDPQFTSELRSLANEQAQLTFGEYVDFPGVAHGFAVKGDPSNEVQRAALEKAMQQFLEFAKREFAKL